MDEYENSKNFHEAFINEGGIVDWNISEYLETWLGVGNGIVRARQKRKPGLPDCYINFITNDSFCAFATKYKGQYFIGIGDSCVIVLIALFYRMLANPSILSKFGDSTLEKEIEKDYDAHITNINFIQTKNIPTPIDPERAKLAMLMVQLAFESLVVHEYAHIINGHIDYLIDIGNLEPISELIGIFSDDEHMESLRSQTLEMDADAYSALKGVEILKDLFNTPVWRDHYKAITKIEDLVYIWSFSIYSLWRLFGKDDFQIDKLKNYSHPPPGIRQHMILRLMDNIDKYYPETYSHHDIFLSAITEAEEAFDKISEINHPFKALAFANQIESIEHANEIVANWANIRSHLLKFASNGLAEVEK